MMESLLAINGVVPPASPSPQQRPLPDAAIDEVKLIYQRDYAPALDALLETQWFTQRSVPKVLLDQRLMDLFLQMLDLFRSVRGNDHQGLQLIRSLETKVVWNLISLPRSPGAASNGIAGSSGKDETLQLVEVQRRIDALEALLTNTTLERNPCLDIPYNLPARSDPEYWQREFWRLLGHSVTLSVPGGPDTMPLVYPTGADADQTLRSCREILGNIEARDVLYSAMVCRLLGPRFHDFPNGVREAFNNDHNDPRTKVVVAKRYLEEQGSSGKATTQAMGRVCEMMVRSWLVQGR
jgi:white-opaque regulator 2